MSGFGGRGRGRNGGGGRRNFGGGRSNNYQGRGGGGGGGGSDFYNTPAVPDGEQPLYSICAHHARDGTCRFGDTCRKVHTVGIALKIKAHEWPIKSMSVLADGPRILTGSADCTVKVWNISCENPAVPEVAIYSCGGQAPTSVPPHPRSLPGDVTLSTAAQVPGSAGFGIGGLVRHICVQGSTIMWSAEESLPGDAAGIPVGVVYMFDPTNLSTLAIKRSDEHPYTHPLPVRAFLLTVVDGVTYTITGGGEGVIKIWKFDQPTNKFEVCSTLEGHIRDVTCLLLIDSRFLWSGSSDRTIRVWEIATGRCVGALNVTSGGHTEAVSCLEHIPAIPQAPAVAPGDSYIASGGIDGEVKLWTVNGENVGSWSHKSIVSSLKVFKDDLGGQQVLLVGLYDGSIWIRSCATMNLLLVIESSIAYNQAAWALEPLGHSCFASATEDGQVIVWRIEKQLVENGTS